MEAAEMISLVQEKMAAFDFARVTTEDARRALGKERLGIDDLGALLSPAAAACLEEMALHAKEEAARFFGGNIALYTPMYIANYCVNQCSYCGYNCKNKIRRAKLTMAEIEAEAWAIAQTGLQDILLLTGESKSQADPVYIGEAITLLRKYFNSVGIEIYPLETEEYRMLHELGADFVSVYQETYDPALYDLVHVSGPKKNYAYRFAANDRALAGGFRGVAFGALLGLGNFRKDVLACAFHAALLHKKYPHAEISFSAPRIRPYPNKEKADTDVHEADLLQILLALRIFMPWAGISLSTRERAYFRDSCIGLGVTRMSAGVSTGVGGHSGAEKGDEQFIKSDERSVAEIRQAIISRGFQPVFNDYVRV